MTTYRPCLHCHRRKSCPTKADKQKAVRGLGLSMVDFRCTLAVADFRPGERVMAVLDDFFDDGEETPWMRPLRRNMAGTVMRWKARKVLVQFDGKIVTAHGDKVISIIAMWPDRLTKLNERPRELCACGFVQKDDGDCGLPKGFVCYETPSTNDPEGMYGPPPSAVAAVKDNEMLLAEYMAGEVA